MERSISIDARLMAVFFVMSILDCQGYQICEVERGEWDL